MERDIAHYGANSAYVLRTWFASWDSPEGVCWPEFDRTKHIVSQNPADFPIWRAGYDHGFGSHPCCCLIAGLTRDKPRRMHVFFALHGTGIHIIPPEPQLHREFSADARQTHSVIGWAQRKYDEIAR